MLRHGIQERHRQPLMVLPGNRAEMPDPGLLEVAYRDFRSA
jgi:putative restriction endonuclease